MWIKYRNNYSINVNNLANIYIYGIYKTRFVYAERSDIKPNLSKPRTIELFSGTKEECQAFYEHLTQHIAMDSSLVEIDYIFKE